MDRKWRLWGIVLWIALAAPLWSAPANGAEGNPGEKRGPILLLGVARTTFGVGDATGADAKPFWSPRAGVTYTAPRDAVTAFEIGLCADARGGEWKDSGSTLKRSAGALEPPAYTHQLRLIYLSAPLLFRLSWPTRPWTPYLKAGVNPEYLVSAKGETRMTETGVTVRGSHGFRDDLKHFHLDVVAGGGVRTDLWRRALIFEALYLHGLTEVLDEARIEGRPNLKNRSVQFFLGIGLRKERVAG
jgi:hypothetical protein